MKYAGLYDIPILEALLEEIMENTGKSNLHMVEANWDEIERKVREHRLKQLRLIAIIVGICAAIGITYYVYMQHKSYDDYNIINQGKTYGYSGYSFYGI